MKLLLFIFFISFYSICDAQIYSQGKNLNNEKIYHITIELVKVPGTNNFYASADFYGRRKNITYYLKNQSGIEHKIFKDFDDLKSYMDKNGWIYLSKTKNQYSFRRTMENLMITTQD